MITEEIGKRIKEIRSEKGISQEKLALKAELDRTYVAGVENGKRRNLEEESQKCIRNWQENDSGQN